MYYNTREPFFVFSFTKSDVEVKEIDKFLDLLSKSGVGELLERKLKDRDYTNGGRPNYNSFNMLAMIIYSFAFLDSSLRGMEDSCKSNMRVMYIMNNHRPTYKTIGNFINEFILPNMNEIFSMITKEILKECNLTIDCVFIDGSKFEANCNKYKFVWKPTTFHKRLTEKVTTILSKYEIDTVVEDGIISSGEIAQSLIKLDKILNKYDLNDKSNKEHKLAYNELINCFEKGIEYEKKEEICGPNRKSYYKTDHDATAMCLKEDYYSGLGSNMHAAYNVQLSVSNGLIVTFYPSQSRLDMPDFIPTLEKQFKYYGEYPKNVCADAGYGSIDNYRFLNEHNIGNYVKHFSWEGEVHGNNPRQYTFNDNNTITCLNGITGYKLDKEPYHPKKKSAVFYKVEGCNACPFKDYCKRYMANKSEDYKLFEVVEEQQRYVNQSEKNLLSPEGIEIRVNRSCQVEGAFGIIKQDMKYERFRRVSLEKISLEFMLVCLGFNIRKLFKYYRGQNPFTFWTRPDDLEPEEKKKPSAKRLSNKANKNKTKSLNQEAKSSYKYK